VQPMLHWKAINVTHYKGVFLALGIQKAMRMRLIIICGLSGSQYLCTLSHKVTEHKMCVLIFSTTVV